MCFACPGKVVKIENDEVTVDYDGEEKTAKLVEDLGLNKGVYVCVKAGFVIEKVDKEKAEKTLEELKKLK